MTGSGGTHHATPAAGVAIFHPAGALLLGRHAHDGRWATFGGAIEAGEDARSAALREVREEIGVTLERLEQLGTFGGSSIYTVRYADDSTEEYAVTMFATILDADHEPVADLTEIVETQWFSRDDLASIDLASDMQEIVPTALGWFDRHAAQQGGPR